jgi:alkylhydroperoxidase/carboxymuconolactone decarboxylase family protein YurZ
MSDTPVGDLKTEDVPDDILDTHRRMGAVRGYTFPDFAAFLGRHDPEFERVRLEYVRMSYTRPGAQLPVKYKELVASAVLAFKHYPSLKKHLKRAMVEGATLREVLEAMEVASDPGGMAALHYAVDQLIELEQEEPELIARAAAARPTETSEGVPARG